MIWSQFNWARYNFINLFLFIFFSQATYSRKTKVGNFIEIGWPGLRFLWNTYTQRSLRITRGSQVSKNKPSFQNRQPAMLCNRAPKPRYWVLSRKPQCPHLVGQWLTGGALVNQALLTWATPPGHLVVLVTYLKIINRLYLIWNVSKRCHLTEIML